LAQAVGVNRSTIFSGSFLGGLGGDWGCGFVGVAVASGPLGFSAFCGTFDSV
jgi:hypothetical protein